MDDYLNKFIEWYAWTLKQNRVEHPVLREFQKLADKMDVNPNKFHIEPEIQPLPEYHDEKWYSDMHYGNIMAEEITDVKVEVYLPPSINTPENRETAEKIVQKATIDEELNTLFNRLAVEDLAKDLGIKFMEG